MKTGSVSDDVTHAGSSFYGWMDSLTMTRNGELTYPRRLHMVEVYRTAAVLSAVTVGPF